MLTKLIKHEFKATGRIIVFLFAVLAILTPATSLYLKFSTSSLFGEDNIIVDTLTFVSVLAYTCAMIAAIAATFFVLLNRFYKSCITTESYLTHTLPVKTSSLIISKTLVATVWQLLSIIMVLLSGLIFTKILAGWSFSDLHLDKFFTIMEKANITPLTIILFILLILTSLITFYLKFYASFAIGHLINGHPFLGFFIAYIAIYIILNIISSILVGTIALWDFAADFDFGKYVNLAFIGLILFNVVQSVVFFFTTTSIFKNKLNI